VPATNVRAIPHTIPFDDAAAFTLATLTAWRMIVTRACVKPGEDVLIWGMAAESRLPRCKSASRSALRTWVVSGSDENSAALANWAPTSRSIAPRSMSRGQSVNARASAASTSSSTTLESDLGAVSPRAGAPRPACQLRSDNGSDRRHRPPSPVLESVVDSRIDDGERRGVRCGGR